MGALFAGLKDIVKSLPWKTWLVVFLIGALFGWFVLGWWIAPVKWVDAAPQHLEPTWRADYMRMVIESFTYNGNADLAKVRYQGLGDAAPKVLEEVTRDPGYLNPADIERFKSVVLGQAPAAVEQGPAAQGGGQGKSGFALVGLCLVVLVGLAAIGGIFFFMRKKKAADGAAMAPGAAVVGESGPAPLSSYHTTYTLGDDYFDESFSIDTASGEFLGEAGLSFAEASETQPKYVRAFEVWLFDKAGIRTETAVLCTPELFADEEARQRLEARGTVVAAAPGQVVTLKTEKLQLEAQVTECEFGDGPEGQYFAKLTVTFRVFLHEEGESATEASSAEGLPA